MTPRDPGLSQLDVCPPQDILGALSRRAAHRSSVRRLLTLLSARGHMPPPGLGAEQTRVLGTGAASAQTTALPSPCTRAVRRPQPTLPPGPFFKRPPRSYFWAPSALGPAIGPFLSRLTSALVRHQSQQLVPADLQTLVLSFMPHESNFSSILPPVSQICQPWPPNIRETRRVWKQISLRES